MRFANRELQKTIELRAQYNLQTAGYKRPAPATQSNCYAATPMHFASAR